MNFLLHHWRLIRIHRVSSSSSLDLSSSSQSSSDNKKNSLPCIVFSHGLTGNALTYSYLIMNLASHGYCVIALDHTDGSALHAFGPNGMEIPLDESLSKYDRPETFETYVKGRRNQTPHRVQEVISMIQLLSDTKGLDSPVRSILDTIQPTKVIGIGHSFGGATVLAAAALRPDLFHSVVALDPAMDWMPDYARWSWLGQRCKEYKGGTGGYSSSFIPEKEIEYESSNIQDQKNPNNKSVHDIPSFFLYSEEWSVLGWGGFPFIQSLHQKGLLGPSSKISAVSFVPGSSHMAFSDICMLIPTWIARSLGLTGKRNPHHVSEEICQRVLDFLRENRNLHVK
jgi:pimeloyl-ACP methyl ester carboxylesterase